MIIVRDKIQLKMKIILTIQLVKDGVTYVSCSNYQYSRCIFSSHETCSFQCNETPINSFKIIFLS